MQTFYGEEDICPNCDFTGKHEKVLENLFNREEGISQIIFVCPRCGCSTLRGENVGDEEFYY